MTITITPPAPAREPVRMTAAEFDAFIESDDAPDTILELINGFVYDKMGSYEPLTAEQLYNYREFTYKADNVTGNAYVGEIEGILLIAIGNYLIANNIGRLTPGDSGYWIKGERFAPDISFTSHKKQKGLSNKGFNPVAPDLAVEVISDPTNYTELRELRLKISHYLSAGIVVWVVDYSTFTIEVYLPGVPPQVLSKADTLSGGDVLPGFTIPVAGIFPKPRPAEYDDVPSV